MSTSCPICNSTSSFRFETQFVKVAECNNKKCGHFFAVDVPEGFGICEKTEGADKYAKYKARNEKLLSYFDRNKFIRKGTKVLDIGSGDGHLLRSIKDRNADQEIIAVEPSKSYWEDLKALGLHVYEYLEHIPDQKADAILLIEVIEHLDDPIPVLTAAKKHLKKGGKLFLTTPSGTLGETEKLPPAYDNPTHLHFFTIDSLKLCLKKAGFRKITYRYIPEMYPGHVEHPYYTNKIRLKNHLDYLKGKNVHLTFFAS